MIQWPLFALHTLFPLGCLSTCHALAIRAEAQDHLRDLEGSSAILQSSPDQTARSSKSTSTLLFCQLFEGFQGKFNMHGGTDGQRVLIYIELGMV